MQDHLPAICAGSLPAQKLRLLQAVHHFYRAVMAKLHAFRQFANGGFPADRESSHRQKKKILLRLKPRRAGGLLAGIQEVPNLIAEFRQRAKFGRAHGFGHRQGIVSDQDRDSNLLVEAV